MLIEGSFQVCAPRPQVWRRITDPGLMASCIPGCRSIEMMSPTTYAAAVDVGIGPIKTTFNLVVEITGEDPPTGVTSTTRGEEGSRASMLSAENRLTLVEIDAGRTEVSYASEVSVTGRLGKFGLGVMKKKAESMGRAFIAAFQAAVEEPPVTV